MTTRERFNRTMKGETVDRVPFMKVFGGDNAVVPAWEREYPGIGKEIDRLLQFEGGYRGWRCAPVNTNLSRRGKPKVLKEDEEKRIERYRDGLVMLVRKNGDYHGQTIEWPVKNRSDWERVKREHLDPDDPERFPGKWKEIAARYRERDYPLQLTHGGVYGFARTIMGDEHLAYAFYDDPALVHDIMETYTDMVIEIGEKMLEETDFDLIECWEDMACRTGCLISPKTFREFMKPHYEKLAFFAKKYEIETILVDSDGYIEDLVPLMLESGVTALYPFEVQSGNDCFRVRKNHPEVGIIGGLNKNAMADGPEAIAREIEKARQLIRLGRFIPGPDHFVLSDVTFANYRYFMEQLRTAVLTTEPGA